jgi:hypothetical protein
MRFYWLVIGILGVWRITHLCVAEEGPWNIMVRFRRVLHSVFWNDLTGCFYCLSMWTAAPIAVWLGESWPERFLLWPALSAGAIFLERIIGMGMEPAVYHEDTAEPDYPIDQKE